MAANDKALPGKEGACSFPRLSHCCSDMRELPRPKCSLGAAAAAPSGATACAAQSHTHLAAQHLRKLPGRIRHAATCMRACKQRRLLGGGLVRLRPRTREHAVWAGVCLVGLPQRFGMLRRVGGWVEGAGPAWCVRWEGGGLNAASTHMHVRAHICVLRVCVCVRAHALV